MKGLLLFSDGSPVPRREAFPEQSWMPWQGNMHFLWIHLSASIQKKVQDILIHGTNGHSVKVYYKGQRGEGVYDVAFPGLIRNVEQRYRETGSEAMKQEYESFMRITPCTTCKGQRLKKESLAVTVADKNIYEVTNMPVQKLQGFLCDLKLSSSRSLLEGRS